MRKSLRNRLFLGFFLVVAVFAGGVGITLTVVHDIQERSEFLLERYWQDSTLISEIYGLLSDVSLFLSSPPDNPENSRVLEELQGRIANLKKKIEDSTFREDFRVEQVEQMRQLQVSLGGPLEVLNRLQQESLVAESVLDALLREATRHNRRDLILDLTIAALAYRDYYVTANPSDHEIYRQQIERIRRQSLPQGSERLFATFQTSGELVFQRRIELRQSQEEIVARIRTISDALRERTEIYARRVVQPTGELVISGMQAISRLLLAALALAGIAALATGIVFARRISKPLEQTAITLRRLEEGDLEARVEPSGAEEIDVLGRAVNSLAISLQRSLDELHATVRTLGEGEERYRLLAEQRLELERIINASPTIAFLCRAEEAYPVLFMSRNIGQFHYLPEEFLGGERSIIQLAAPEERERIAATLHDRLGEPQCHDFFLEHCIVTGNGEVRRVDARLSILRDSDGRATHLQGVLLDITDKVRLREQAAQASRLASLGELAAGVAHEINNPNATILLNAALLRDIIARTLTLLDELWRQQPQLSIGPLPYARLRGELPRLGEDILGSAERIRRIVEDLKEFTRFTPAELRKPVELNQVAAAAARLTANALKRATDHFRIELADGLPPVSGHAQQLEQVVVNLLLNACQALPDRGRGVVLRSGQLAESGEVYIEVADQGCGISAEHLPHVIDPFFTTRREEGGTGLGLSVSARIIHEHQGRFEFHSHPGEGTIVRMILPLPPAGAVP